MMTARLCEHARQRCAEMGITTKVAKAIARVPDVTFPATPGPNGEPRYLVHGKVHRDYALVIDEPKPGLPIHVITVLLWAPEGYRQRDSVCKGGRHGDPQACLDPPDRTH